MPLNKITDVTRNAINDEIDLSHIHYAGRMDEPDFWMRLVDLKNKPSRGDDRWDNAYDDIYQHMVRNRDWDDNWFMTDPRINLLHGPDDLYKAFLALTVHPRVRTEESEVAKLIGVYNKHLASDGLRMTQTSDISGKPVYEVLPIGAGVAVAAASRQQIKKHLNTNYVDAKIKIMHDNIRSNTDLAIGTGKELLETACKSILKQRSVQADKDWNLSQLFRETLKQFDFTPAGAEDKEQARRGIDALLKGVNSIVFGIGELRNSYGTGHGKDADFQGIESKYAELYVGLVSQVVILLLATNGEQAELVEAAEEF
jgi:hypothetical protein